MAELTSQEKLFHEAAENGYLEELQNRIKLVDINSKDNQQRTALHKSTSNGHLKATKFLIENGSQVDAQDENGQTPLHLSALENNLDIAKCLVQNGAQVDVKDNENFLSLIHI